MERALLLGIRSGVFLLLLMPLLVTSDTIFPYVVGKALYSRALIEAVFGLWLVLALISPSHRPPRSLLLKAYGVFLVVTLLAAFFGVSLQRSLWSDYRRMQGVVDLAHWFALVPVLVSAFRSLPDWRTLLNVNLAVSAVVALIGVAQQNDVGVPFLDFLEVKPRVDSTLGHPAWLGAYMLVNVLVGLGLLAFSTQRDRAPQATGRAARSRRRRMARTSLDSSLVWWRLFWLSAVVIDLWVLFQSGTRGAFTGLLAGLLVFALVYAVWGRLPSLRRLSFVVLGIVAAVVFFVVLARYVGPLDTVTSRNVTLERVANIGMDDPAIKGRVVSWGIGFDGFLARPVLGWGPESYTIVWGRFFESESGVLELLDQAHNKPLEELVTKGILGLLSYLLLWGIVFRALVIMVRAQDAREQLFTLFVGAALAAYFVQNLFLFDTATGSLQLALLLGFVVYQESKSESPETLRPASTPLSKMPRFMRPAVDSAHFSKYALALALILVSLSVYLVAYRPYVAATTALSALNPTVPWDRRLERFERSFDSFGGLANFPRHLFFTHLTNRWDTMTVAEAEMAMAMVEEEGRRALYTEPRGWRLYVGLSRLYKVASALDSGYLERSESYARRASELAPDMWRVIFVEDEGI